MAERILVRSSQLQWPFYLASAIGIIISLAGLLLAFQPRLAPMGGILLVAGIITLLASFYYEYQRKKQIMWLVLGTHQFTLLEPTRERTFHDDDVVSMSLQVKENFSNGVHASTTRTFRIWVVSHENLPELIILKSTNKVAESPLLVPFIERISQQLLRRAQEERLRNQSTLGEGWELSSQQLLLRSSLGDLEVPLKELVAVQPVDGKLKIWSTQSEHAVAELPVDSANAHLLQLLLQQHIAHQVQIPAQAAGHLGHILFEKRTHRIPLIVMGIFAILLFFVFLLIGLAIIAGKGAPQDRNAQWIALAFVTLVLSFFVFLCYGYWRSFIRCHARGIHKRGFISEQKLFFDEVEHFTYSATKVYHNGGYLGTYVRLILEPLRETGKKSVAYTTIIKNMDAALEDLRDLLAKKISQRWVSSILSGNTLEWTKQLKLEPTGLRYSTKNWFSGSKSGHLGYQEIHYHTLTPEKLTLFQAGQPKPFVTESTTSKNFYPGYWTLMYFMHAQTEATLSTEHSI